MLEDEKQDITATVKDPPDTDDPEKVVEPRTSDDSLFNPQREQDQDIHPTTLTEEEIATEVCHLAGDPMYCKIIKAALRMENQVNIKKKSHADLASLPIEQYLEQTIVPILMTALARVAMERPPEPVLALAAFLLKERDAFEVKADGTSKNFNT